MKTTSSNRVDQMKVEYARPDLARHLAKIKADSARRTTSDRAPDAIVSAARFKGSPEAFLLSPVKGSIMLFWGRHDSDIIPRLEKAYAVGDRRTLKKLSDIAIRDMKRHPVASLEAGVEAVLTSSMHFDLMYGSKELARSLVLPDDVEYGAIAFAYNGGLIDEGAFKVVQHTAGKGVVAYRTLLVRVSPDLSELERKAIEAVPPDQSFINIGEASICPAATVALVAIVVALVTKAGVFDEMRRRLDDLTLSDSQIKRLGSLATARELVALRREVFEEYGC